jgi:putative transposase
LDETNRKLRIDGRTGKLREKVKKRKKKQRRKGYQPQLQGDLLQIDSMTFFLNGLKRYVITAIDIKSRFGFGYSYDTLSSNSAKDFFRKVSLVFPFEVKRVQTDNGQEFCKHFEQFLESENITHFFNYPGHPKSNSYVERFNRTVKEQYINWHLNELEDTQEFNKGLMKYLLWYNTEKPHKGINGSTPIDFILNSTFPHPKNSNMLRYHTQI